MSSSSLPSDDRQPRIFLSYRRDDNPYAAGRLYDHLVDRFGEEAIFFDVTANFGGVDFRKLISHKIAECDAVVVVIGGKWLELADDEGLRRIDQPDDFVHIEIRSALDRGIPITPVTVDTGNIPKPKQLPAVLQDLSYRSGFQASAANFRLEVGGIIDAIRKGIEINREMAAAGAPELIEPTPIRETQIESAIEPYKSGLAPRKVPSPYKYDLFLSYAHADDAPLSPGDHGWVTEFTDKLRDFLRMRLGRDVNLALDDLHIDHSADVSQSIADVVRNSAVLLAIISPRYVSSEWCVRELEEFVPKTIDGKINTFFVHKYPVNKEQLPATARDVLGYQFFTHDQDIPVELSASSPEFLRSIGKLAYDIAKMVESLEGE